MFLTYNNQLEINHNDLISTDDIFLTTSKNFPVTNNKIDDYQSLIKSLSFFQNILANPSIVLDFEIKNLNLSNYQNLIFPHHQEYIEEESLIKIKNYLNSDLEQNKIFSVGESFKHFFEYDNKTSLIKMKRNNIKISEYNFVTDYKDLDFNEKKCSYNKNYINGIHVDFKNTESEKKFQIKKNRNCKKNFLISQKQFGKNLFINFNFENLIHTLDEKSEVHDYIVNLF